MGFVTNRPRYRWVTHPGKPEEGQDPFEVELRCNLTVDEIQAMPWGDYVKYEELWPAIAPHIRAWNAEAETATGEIEPLPLPSEAGPEILGALPPYLSTWIGLQLRMLPHAGGPDRKKDVTPPEPTPEPLSDAATA